MCLYCGVCVRLEILCSGCSQLLDSGQLALSVKDFGLGVFRERESEEKE